MLDGLASWDKDSIICNVWIKFHSEIDANKVFWDCPNIYFVPKKAYGSGNAHFYFYTLNSSLDEIEEALNIISRSARL